MKPTPRIAAGVAALVLLAACLWLVPAGGGPGPPAPSTDVSPVSRPDTNPVDEVRMEDPAPETSSAAPRPDSEGVLGRVLDFEGRPVAGATVGLRGSSTTSAGDGTFSLPEPEFSATGAGGTLVASKEGFGTAQVEVRRGHPRALEVVLPPAAEILGDVVGPDGPVGGARVELRDGAWSRVAASGADGRFRFPEARTLRCEVVAMADGFRPACAQVAPGVSARRVRLFLPPCRDRPVRVVDEGGNPVEGAEVTARLGWPEASVTAITDRNGFAMRLPHPDWRGSVSVVARGFAPTGGPLTAFEGTEVTVVLRKEIVLEARAVGGGGPEEWRHWSVALGSNRWQDPRAPSPPREPEFGPGPSQPIGLVGADAWVAVDPGGKALLRGVREGNAYTLVATKRGATGNQESYRFVVWRTGRLPAETRVIEWTPPGLTRIDISTREAGTGAAVPATVIVRADPETLAAREADLPSPGHRMVESVPTGPDGRAALWLWPGKFTLTAYAGPGSSGDLSASADLVVGEGEGRVEILFPVSYPVRGRLRTASGVPLPGRQVFLGGTGAEPRHYFVAKTDDSGAFEIRGVPEGDYDVWWDGARGESHGNGPRRISVPTGPVEVTVPLCTLRGDVRPTAAGAAVVVLQSAYPDGTWRGNPIFEPLDDTGAFEVSGLCPGEWDLQVRKADGSILGKSTRITVADGAYVCISLE